MPTNNPKVSAYIPQHLFDRFKSFYEERDISMSQAVAVIFAEYFQLDLQVNYISSSPGAEAIATKLEVLEKEVQDLKSVTNEPSSSLLSDLQNLQYLVNQIENRLSEVEAKQDSELNSSLQSNLLQIPQEDDSVKQSSILEAIENQSEGDRVQVVSNEVQPVENLPIEDLNVDEPLIGSLSESLGDLELDLSQLARRLGTTYGTVNNKKARCKDNPEEFLSWIQNKDPDNIQWVESGLRGRARLYKPVDNTPSELLSKLHKWIKENLP